jgi:hypothetical protein
MAFTMEIMPIRTDISKPAREEVRPDRSPLETRLRVLWRAICRVAVVKCSC